MITSSDQMIINITAIISSIIFLVSAIKNYKSNSLRSLTFLFSAISFFIKTVFDFWRASSIVDKVIYSMIFVNCVVMFEFLIAKIILHNFENVEPHNSIDTVKKIRKINFTSNMFQIIRYISMLYLFFIAATYFNFIVINNYDIYCCIIADAFLIIISLYGTIAVKHNALCQKFLLYSLLRLGCFLILLISFNNIFIRITYICLSISSSCVIVLIAASWRNFYDKCN